MRKIELVTPCHFGLEAVLKREIYDLGYDVTSTFDGRVRFTGDAEAVVLANLHLRTAERVLLLVGSFHAGDYEEFYQGMRALPWEEYLPKDAKFWVTKVSTIKSRLYSASDLQSVAKKAMVERLKETYHVEWFREEGASYPVRIFLMRDEAMVTIDTTGVPLHKRGYRTLTAKAPLSETLAAALLMLTPWKEDRILMDPFCGSGTFAIEAAMRAAHIAPGLRRTFTAEAWENLIAPKLWAEAREDAEASVTEAKEGLIFASDRDKEMIRIARSNAKKAGVERYITFRTADVSDVTSDMAYGFLVTNPPYGERLSEKEELPAIYTALGETYRSLDAWSLYVITGYEDALRYIGRKPDKNRKIYNGMMQTRFYSFAGPKPVKKTATEA